ncbi:biopolymer transporter ExbD, partial [bacterium]|nr:biopolymer transporter ExbD [bacterium]
SFILQPGIVIDLPSAVKTEVIPKQSAIITVTENEHIYLNDKISSLEKLSEQLSSFPKDSVIIQADGEVALGVVVSVWDICRSLGIEKLNIATRQKKFS